MSKKIISGLISCLLIISLFLVQGCASNIKLIRENINTEVPIKVARYETPKLEKRSLGRVFLTAVPVGVITYAGGLLLGIASIPVFSLIDTGISKHYGSELSGKCELKDYGELIIAQLAIGLNDEIDAWPEIEIVDEAIDADYYDSESYLLSIQVNYINLFNTVNDENIIISTTAELKDIFDNAIWRKKFNYSANDFNRKHNIQELEADNCNLLKEEIDFAVNKTVTAFIEDLKESSDSMEIRANIENNNNIDQ
jgi:hypothetical protein